MSNNAKSLQHARRAFTTVEFMVAISIGVVVSVIALSGYHVYERELPVRHAANRLEHAASTARALAIAHNTTYAVRFDRRYSNFWIDETTPDGTTVMAKVTNPTTIDDTKVELLDIWFGSVPLGSGGTDPVSFRFFPDGSSDDARIFMKLIGRGATPGNTYTVRLYGPTGQAEVFENQRLETTTGP